jgi:predicted ribosomally synthesized peptide with SipW-like signal peptide
MAGSRHRKGTIRAILAGGVVLGVGAAVTLAAWNSSDFATGTFKAGTFGIEGSTDNGVSYANHSSTSPATLAFDTTAVDLSPNTTTYAPYAVRLAAGTTDGGTVTLTSAGTTGTVTNLTYAILETTSSTCNSSTTGTSLVPAGTVLGTVPGSTTFTLTPGSPTTSAGSPQYLCIEVTAGSSLVQGQSGAATWQFGAVSN